jgi:hypothetical protein
MRRCSDTDKVLVRFVSVLRVDAENDPLHPLLGAYHEEVAFDITVDFAGTCTSD